MVFLASWALWAARTRSWIQMWTQRNTCDQGAQYDAVTLWIMGYGVDLWEIVMEITGRQNEWCVNGREETGMTGKHLITGTFTDWWRHMCWILHNQLPRGHDTVISTGVCFTDIREECVPAPHASEQTHLIKLYLCFLSISGKSHLTEQVGWSGNAFDFHSERARFESL